jgi:hypothetical protein
MSYLVAPFCSELEELTYDLVEGAFRQEPSVSIDRLHGHLGLPFRNHPGDLSNRDRNSAPPCSPGNLDGGSHIVS